MAIQPIVPPPVPQPGGPPAGGTPPAGVSTAVSTKLAPPPPLPPKPIAAPGSSPDNPLPPEEQDQAPIAPGFFQQPWVQNLLPFITSLTLHAAVIIFAVLTIKAIQIIKAPPTEEQVIVPDSNMVENQPPGGVPNVGLGGDPFKQSAQDKTPDGGTPDGWAEKKGPSVNMQEAGGGSGDSSDSIISVGPGGGFGRGKGAGSGKGAGAGSGSGDGAGALAMFGTPGGGGSGLKGPVFGHGGNARTIMFVCDCTGSMITKIAQLKIELSRAIQGLRPIQSFNVIFYQDEKFSTFDKTQPMVPATPENKRKFESWLEDVVASGTTDPVPALTAGLKVRPNLLYFLTDAADFPDVKAVQDVFKKVNADHKTRVNTILFVANKDEQNANKESEPLMQGISSANGGVFRWVRMDEL